MALPLPKGFVICDVTRINITKEVLLFAPNQTLQRVRYLSYVSLSVSGKFPLVNYPLVNSPPLRVRLGVGQLTGRQFGRGEFTGGN